VQTFCNNEVVCVQRVYSPIFFSDNDELQQQGYIRLYEPTDWFEVVPVTHILGKLPIFPDFSTRTIPHSMTGQPGFPKGKCDSHDGKQLGSKIFYINHFAMTWSRSKLSLFRSFPACVLYVYKVCPKLLWGGQP
jgi:hypothetical protein